MRKVWGYTVYSMNGDIRRRNINLEQAEKMLYEPGLSIKQKPRAKLHRDHTAVPVRWNSQEPPKEPPRKKIIPTSLFSKLFIGSLVFFVVAALVAVITIATSANVSSKRISLEVLGRTFVDGGEPLPLQVVITNNNNTKIELADVVIAYQTNTGDTQRIRQSVGTVEPRKQTIQDFNITLFGEEGTVVPLAVTLEYRIPDSNAILTKQTTYTVTLRSTPIVLSVLGPQTTLPNQEVTMNYTIVSNSASVVEDVVVTTEYPQGFTFAEADPVPAFSNNVWILGDLEPGAARTIAVTGVVHGNEGEVVAFRGAVGRQDPNDEKRVGAAFATIAQPLALESSFMRVMMTPSGLTNGILPPTGTLDVTIAWSNPLPVRVSDAQIEVTLNGSYNPETIRAQRGFYNSNTKSIIWNKDGDENFAVLEPGESGEISFSLDPLVTTSSSLNPSITIKSNIQGVIEGGTFQSAQSVSELVVKVASDLRILGDVQHFTGPFANTGPMPPKVGQQTTYTIVFTATNSSNAVTDAQVRTTLPEYVTWTNAIAPQQAPITYNPVTREVLWTVGALSPGVGYTKPAVQVSFQVGITPSASQVGEAPLLTSDIILRGRDGFTGADLQSTRRGLSTRLLNDTSSVGSDGRVVQ